MTNSNRFSNSNAAQSLTIIDTKKIRSGEDAIVGTVPAGVFPRELRLIENQNASVV